MLWRLFPGGGRFPFSLAEAAAGVAFCVVGLVVHLARRARARAALRLRRLPRRATSRRISSRRRSARTSARLRFAAIPLAVLVFSLRRWRPRVLGHRRRSLLAVSWNVTPLAASYVQGTARDVTTQRAHVARGDRVPARAPRRRRTASRRSTPPTHWPAVYLADAGIPIARGWFRQDDFPQNEVLYDKLGAKAYLAWLRGLGVKYVVLSHAPPDYSARGEARLAAKRPLAACAGVRDADR